MTRTSTEDLVDEVTPPDPDPLTEAEAEASPETETETSADAEADSEAATIDGQADPEDKSPDDANKKRPRARQILTADPLRSAAFTLTVIAALCAAWFGWSWYGAAHDDSLSYSRTRDEVLRSGEQAVQNLNTLDYRNVSQGLQVWQDSSTAELYQQIVQGRPQFEKAVREARTVTSAGVLEAAVTEMDVHAGKASVIVALRITVTPPKGEATVKKTRLMGQLTRTSSGWKLNALGQAPTATSGS